MPAWKHTHCPNCNMPYPRAAAECGACGRARDPIIVPPPVVDAARPEFHRRGTPPSFLKVTPNDAVTIAVAVVIALLAALIRIYGF